MLKHTTEFDFYISGRYRHANRRQRRIDRPKTLHVATLELQRCLKYITFVTRRAAAFPSKMRFKMPGNTAENILGKLQSFLEIRGVIEKLDANHCVRKLFAWDELFNQPGWESVVSFVKYSQSICGKDDVTNAPAAASDDQSVMKKLQDIVELRAIIDSVPPDHFIHCLFNWSYIFGSPAWAKIVTFVQFSESLIPEPSSSRRQVQPQATDRVLRQDVKRRKLASGPIVCLPQQPIKAEKRAPTCRTGPINYFPPK